MDPETKGPCFCCGKRPRVDDKECQECIDAKCFYRNTPICNAEPFDGLTLEARLLRKLRG
jgi:hypothetical protein